METNQVKIIECPRDAMQGIVEWIPTQKKIEYINKLLRVGFDTLDCGSFVSEKAVPQMKDTAEVLRKIDLTGAASKLLAIVANQRGAEDAVLFDELHYLGYPFSISETFQQRNTNASIEESLERVEKIQSLCLKNKKELVIYISMGFGNPYGDPWNEEITTKWCERLNKELDVYTIALSDTIGIANPETIHNLFSYLIPALPQVEFGAHMHTTPTTWREKVDAAWKAGCKRFDGAIKGFGGCPMASDHLTGNMPTENLLSYFNGENINTGINREAFDKAMMIAGTVFPMH